MSKVDNLNDVTNELLLEYDEKFNKLYNKKVFLNSSIMNKEEIITKLNNEIYNKHINIVKLKYTLGFVVIYCILFLAYGMNKLDFKKLLIIYIILFLIYLVVVNYAIYYIFNIDGMFKTYNKLKVKMSEHIDKIYDESNPYSCPSDCSVIDEEVSRGDTIYGYKQPTLRTDPQLDVWQYGDIPTDLYTSKSKPASKFYINYKDIPNYNATIQEELANEPKPSFGTNFPRTTYYKCHWNGGMRNNVSMPNPERLKYSSIPCSYRPNFTEDGRYICKENPNTSKLNFHSICEDVSKGKKSERHRVESDKLNVVDINPGSKKTLAKKTTRDDKLSNNETLSDYGINYEDNNVM